MATYDAQIRIKVANLNQLKKLEDRVNKVQNALQGKSPTGKQAKANIAATSPELQKEKAVTKELKKQLRIRTKMKGTPGSVGGIGRGGKGKGALSGALISGAFPLLFGQGPLGGLAGFTGGLIGGKVGGQMGGFAGGLLATAALTQIQQFLGSAAQVGQAFSQINPNLDTLTSALGLAGSAEEKRIKLIEQTKGSQAALTAVTERMNEMIGAEAVKNLTEFGEVSRLAGNEFKKAMTKIQAALAPFLKGFLVDAQRAENKRLAKIAGSETNPQLLALRGELADLESQTGGGRKAVKDRGDRINVLKAEILALEENLAKTGKVLELEQLRNDQFNAAGQSLKEQNQFLENSINLGKLGADIEKEKLRRAKLLGIEAKDLTKEQVKQIENDLTRNKQLKEQLQTQEQIKNILAGGMTNAVMGLIEGSRTLGSVLADVAKQLASMFLNKAFSSIFSGLFSGGVSGIGPVASGSQYASMLGGAVGLYSSAGSFKAFRQGGIVTSPTMGIIGEGGESEYVIPASKMSGAMSRYSAGARGGAVIPGGSHESGTVAGSSGNTVVEYTGPTLNFNGDEYVPKSAVPEIIGAATKRGAQAGKAQVIGSLRNSRSQRASLGL